MDELKKFIAYQYEHSFVSYGFTRKEIFTSTANFIQHHMDTYTDWREYLTQEQFEICSKKTHHLFDKLVDFQYRKSRSN